MSNFLLGAAIPFAFFTVSLARQGGARSLLLFGRAIGRTAVRATMIASPPFLVACTLALTFAILNQKNITTAGIFSFFSLAVPMLAMCTVPLFFVLLPIEATVLRMYLTSSMKDTTLVVLLSMGAAGAWASLVAFADKDSVFPLLCVVLFFTYTLAVVCGFSKRTAEKHPRMVNTLERAALFVLAAAAVFIIATPTEHTLPPLLLGYGAGAAILQFVKALWSGAPPERLTEQSGAVPPTKNNIAVMRLVSAGVFLATLFGLMSDYPLLVLGSLLLVADISAMSSPQGYAHIWIDWDDLQKAVIPKVTAPLRARFTRHY